MSTLMKYLLFKIFFFNIFHITKCDYLQNLFFSDSYPQLCITEIECLKVQLKLEKYCSTCSIVLPVVKFMIATGRKRALESIAYSICVGPDIVNIKMCKKIIDTYKPTVYKVLMETPLSDDELCHAFLDCKPVTNHVLNWTLEMPQTKKPAVDEKDDSKPVLKKLRILHLTDIHIDIDYQPGSLADCDQILCCRNDSTSSRTKLSKNRLAGKWGDYRFCDLPVWTLESMFKHISKTDKFDFIYWTGDLGPHSVWTNSKETQLIYFTKLNELFQKYFPNKKIYSTIGNHDSEPDNLFPFNSNNSMRWLYRPLSLQKPNLPVTGESNFLNIKNRGAFYTIELGPGLRVFSLNNNYCYAYNFWLFINSVDPLDQLKYLVDVLQTSEDKGEKVHIIGHINPSGCMRSFSENYYRIVNRYESTIVGQFFGHTHNDEFEMFYDLENITRPVGVAYMTGSISSYTFQNPAYRIYTVDGIRGHILDHETFYMNITEANLNPNRAPVWKKEYSAQEAYNLKNLKPSEWNNLIEILWNDLDNPLMDKMLKLYNKSYHNSKKCDLDCRKSFLCKLKQARSDIFIKCY